jgi:hypothetical protein
MFRYFGRVDIEQFPPLYLTGEQRGVTIHALLDRDTPEWLWLAEMYGKIIDAARADNSEILFVIHPLGYQLDSLYPYLPQAAFEDFCRENGVDCIDLLPPMRAAYARGDPTFGFADSESYDVWHYKTGGHAIAADAIADHILEHSQSWRRHRSARE